MPRMMRVSRTVRAKRKPPTPPIWPARLGGLVARIRAHPGRKAKSR